jgi:hypothetical protein
MAAAVWPALRSSLPCMRKDGREQVTIIEVQGEAQRPSSPAGGGGHLLLGQQVAERDSEGDTGLHQQPHGLRFGVPAGKADLQPRDQRPQLANRLQSPTSAAGYVGQPDNGGTECEHGSEVCVVRPCNAEHVRRNVERAGDAP